MTAGELHPVMRNGSQKETDHQMVVPMGLFVLNMTEALSMLKSSRKSAIRREWSVLVLSMLTGRQSIAI
jgi:hypothetical protein